MFVFNSKYEEKSRILTIVNAKQQDIDTFKWPNNVETLYIKDSWIDHLQIPEGIEYVTLSKSVRSIYVPDSIKFLYVANNTLVSLEVPNTIMIVYAPENFLTDFKFRGGDGNPTNLQKLDLSNNNLESLYFIPPDTLGELNITKNMLTPLTISPEILKYAISHEECYVF
jgi:Leucine-rich repeat (LRR) protein